MELLSSLPSSPKSWFLPGNVHFICISEEENIDSCFQDLKIAWSGFLLILTSAALLFYVCFKVQEIYWLEAGPDEGLFHILK